MIILKNKKIQKLISSFIVIALVVPSLTLFFKPTKVDAQAVVSDPINTAVNVITTGTTAATAAASATSTGIQIKNVLKDIAKQFLMVAAKRMLAEMTKSTVNWINTGFHGQPLFLTNSASFFSDIAKGEIKDLVDQVGYDRLKFPFGKQFALQTIQSYKTQAQQNAEYSLNKVVNDPELLSNYRTNFYVGGWDGFLLNTQYPQNNPMGFNLTEAAKLGEKLQETQQTKVQQVKDTLQQGMGFLSPKTCPTNPNYDKNTNEFNKPSFNEAEYLKTHPYNPPTVDPNSPSGSLAKVQYDTNYQAAKNTAKLAFNAKYTCPGGMVSTTPGSVAANSIMKALNVTQEQGTLAAAMGNSLSTIFDTLINHYLDKGLSSLASKINPPQTPDDWSYNGETLGSPVTGNNTFSGPDQEIILSDFKKKISGYTTILNEDGSIKDILVGNVGGGTYTPGDIENTKTEIALMDNKDPINPGILQLMQIVPIETQKLDECLPGLNKGWEVRLQDETQRNSKVLLKESGSSDDLKVKAVNDALRELNFAVKAYKDWVTTKMMASLPDAVTYMDEIKNLDTITQKTSETSADKMAKIRALARLESLQKSLATITKQPDPQDSDQAAYKRDEAKLISIKKQYDAISSTISNTTSIENTKSILNTLVDTLASLKKLNPECREERKNAGWSNDGNNLGDGLLSSINSQPIMVQIQSQIFGLTSINTGQVTGSEIGQFCAVPLISGYSHGDIIREDDSNRHGALKFTFRNPNGNDLGDPGYEDLPMVNAREIYGDDTKKFNPVVVDIDCNTIFKAKPTDYRHSGDPTY